MIRRAATFSLSALFLSLPLVLAPHGARAQHAPVNDTTPTDEGDLAPEGTPSDAGADGGVALPPVTVRSLALDAGAPVASGRGVLVTAGELYQRVQDAPEPTQRAWAADPRGIEGLLDRLVADRLLVNEARRRGLDRDPAVLAAFERALVARLRATTINPSAGDGARVTPDDIRAFYDTHPTRFHIPERRRAWVIFLPDRRDAERVLHLALARRHRRPAHDFRDLIRQYNTDPDLLRTDGELRDLTAASSDVDPAVRDAVFALAEPGDVAEALVRGQWHGTRGYFIVRLGSRRAPIDRTLAESSDWIRQRLVLERRVQAERALVDRLASDARVTRTPTDRVVRVTVEDAGAPPPATTNGGR